MDRFFRGVIAGTVGGIVMSIWDLLSYYVLDFADLRYLDWAVVMIFGSRPSDTPEFILALATHLVWASFLGIIMALLFPVVTSRGDLFKGGYFGFVTGFILYAIPVLFKVQHLEFTTLGSATSHMIGGLMWGVTTAYVLRLLDSSPRVRNN